MMTDKDKSKCDTVQDCDKLKSEKLVQHSLLKSKITQEGSTGLETFHQSDQTANVKKINLYAYNEPNQKVFFSLEKIIIS